MAEPKIRQLKEIAPVNALRGVFLERVASLRVSQPGAEWDGTLTFQSI